jgi:dTDP-4-dehydrorhamnose 3,5-epimerase
MKITPLAIPDVKLIEPKIFEDNRGFFYESYSLRHFEEAGIKCQFVQDSHSLSKDIGIIRGLHFQLPPHAQAKLVRITKGRVWDVAVDLRKKSPTYGQHVSIELSSKTSSMLFLPIGFAHGFITLEANTEILYKMDAYYAPSHDAGIRWDDPDLAINWPINNNSPILSDKDMALPALKDIKEIF